MEYYKQQFKRLLDEPGKTITTIQLKRADATTNWLSLNNKSLESLLEFLATEAKLHNITINYTIDRD